MKKLFLQANIGTITILISLFLFAKFFPQISSTPIIVVLLVFYLDITINNFVFEYQRISLTLARIAKLDSPGFASLSIPEIQLLLSNGSLGFFLFLTSFLTGFTISYLYLNSLIWLIGYLVVRFLISDFIPTYRPHKLLFKIMAKEFSGFDLKDPANLVYKAKLRHYFNEMSHSKIYEDWAFNKYGPNLLKVR